MAGPDDDGMTPRTLPRDRAAAGMQKVVSTIGAKGRLARPACVIVKAFSGAAGAWYVVIIRWRLSAFAARGGSLVGLRAALTSGSETDTSAFRPEVD
jgi:hypothetical protein